MKLSCAASLLVGVLFTLQSSFLSAEEPNDTFAESTILAHGILTVSDELEPGPASFPDTYLGAFDLFGNVVEENDDDSIYGDGYASGFSGVPVNAGGEIHFAVTGFEDYFFEGEHFEAGDYVAYVDVYDFFGDLVDSFSVDGTLVPGAVDDYAYSDFNWFNGSYDVNIDNRVALLENDLDFFTFTGLTVGASFVAETHSEETVDTILGWFDDQGNLLDLDDDDGEGVLSRLEGIVPTSGQLTLAVTGYDDRQFIGNHSESGFYDLTLTLPGISPPGDFDQDGDIDGFDLTHPTLGWEARYGDDLNGGDFLIWQRNVSNSFSAAAVPEPGSVSLTLFALAGLISRKVLLLAPRC